MFPKNRLKENEQQLTEYCECLTHEMYIKYKALSLDFIQTHLLNSLMSRGTIDYSTFCKGF